MRTAPVPVSPLQTLTDFFAVAVAVPLETVSVTSYVPGFAHAFFAFCAVEPVPSPKSHRHDVAPPCEASSKVAAR